MPPRYCAEAREICGRSRVGQSATPSRGGDAHCVSGAQRAPRHRRGGSRDAGGLHRGGVGAARGHVGADHPARLGVHAQRRGGALVVVRAVLEHADGRVVVAGSDRADERSVVGAVGADAEVEVAAAEAVRGVVVDPEAHPPADRAAGSHDGRGVAGVAVEAQREVHRGGRAPARADVAAHQARVAGGHSDAVSVGLAVGEAPGAVLRAGRRGVGPEARAHLPRAAAAGGLTGRRGVAGAEAQTLALGDVREGRVRHAGAPRAAALALLRGGRPGGAEGRAEAAAGVRPRALELARRAAGLAHARPARGDAGRESHARAAAAGRPRGAGAPAGAAVGRVAADVDAARPAEHRRRRAGRGAAHAAAALAGLSVAAAAAARAAVEDVGGDVDAAAPAGHARRRALRGRAARARRAELPRGAGARARTAVGDVGAHVDADAVTDHPGRGADRGRAGVHRGSARVHGGRARVHGGSARVHRGSAAVRLGDDRGVAARAAGGDTQESERGARKEGHSA